MNSNVLSKWLEGKREAALLANEIQVLRMKKAGIDEEMEAIRASMDLDSKTWAASMERGDFDFASLPQIPLPITDP